jgi:hypothetical protein
VRAGRHRGATFAIVVVVLFLALPLAFWLLLRGVRSDSDPALESAQATAHQLLRGSESIDTERRGDGRFVFRIVHQVSDGGVGSSMFSTHLGVVVCANEAARFSYLHFQPACRGGRVELTPQETSAAADRARRGGPFVDDVQAPDEPTPQRISRR